MIYLDNAATSWPKPYTVVNAVRQGMTSFAANPGRGGYAMSVETAEAIFNVRMLAARFFGLDKPENVMFTQNCTHAVNLAFNCFLPENSHIVVSDREHNAVMRPLYALQQQGKVKMSIAKIGHDTANAHKYFAEQIRPETRMLFCVHVSNVDGKVMPIEKIGKLASDHGLLFGVDAAQSAGAMKIRMGAQNIHLLCVPGHKSLYGPMGIGMLLARNCSPYSSLIYGGTGSNSSSFEQPNFLPDEEESGTVNVPGILGLGEGLKFIMKLGEDNIFAHENELAVMMAEKLKTVKDVQLLTQDIESNVVSFVCQGKRSEQIANRLAQSEVCIRAGLHCAPSAHMLYHTEKDGAARLSFGVYNDKTQINPVVEAITTAVQ